MDLYEKRIVAYLDILGFKDLIKKRKVPQIVKILSDFKKAFSNPDETILSFYNLEECTLPDTFLFSDSFVYSTKQPTRDKIGSVTVNFAETVSHLALGQASCIGSKIMLRGAITYGDIYISSNKKNNMMFGPAYVRAYSLEEKRATNSLIMVDDCLVSYISGSLSTDEKLNQLWEYLKKYAIRFCDDQQVWFVDYLRYQKKRFPGDYTKRVLLREKELLVEGKAKFEENSKEGEKYIWLHKYHNGFVSELSDEQLMKWTISREELLIN